MKPAIVADEMFPEGAGPYMDMEEAGGSSGLLMDLSANEKAVHAEFFNGEYSWIHIGDGKIGTNQVEALEEFYLIGTDSTIPYVNVAYDSK